MGDHVKPRPAILRALGKKDPPETIVIDGEQFARRDVFKHDSWAATALYAGQSFDAVCKFNRTHPVLIVPMSWLGRFLANRESFAYRELAGIEGIAPDCAIVTADDKRLSNVAAHQFIPGHPLKNEEAVDDQFFPRLLEILQGVHARGFAYVDLHKRENILVGENGRPYLIDFQISYYSNPNAKWHWPFGRSILRVLQQSDLYHLTKHVRRHRPEQVEQLGLGKYLERPWWIRAHRKIAVPFRTFRRSFLSKIKVRDQSGRSGSETFAEHAFREEHTKQDAA